MSISNENLRRDFGARLRLVLADLEVPQKTAAERLGVAQGYLSEVASGKKMPSAIMIHGLRDVYGVSLDWLLLGRGSRWAATTPEPEGAEPLPSHRHELVTLAAELVASEHEPSISRARGYLEGIRAAGGDAPPHVETVRRRRA